MSMFSFESPLMKFFTKVADLIIINLIALLCCLPIFTIGASLTALHYIVLKMVRNEESSHLIKAYFRSFKSNFKQATVIWLIFLVFAAFFGLDFFIFKYIPSITYPNFIKILLIVMASVVGMVFCYAFPVLARFSNSTFHILKNSLVTALVHIPRTLVMMVMYLLPVIIVYSYPRVIPLIFFLGISGPAYLSALLYNGIFKKLEDRVLSPAKESEEASVDDNTSSESNDTTNSEISQE